MSETHRSASPPLPGRRWPRRLLLIVLLTLGLLIGAGLWAGWWLKQTMARFGIAHWSFEGASLSLDHISLDELRLIRQGRDGQRLEVEMGTLWLDWSWSGGWRPHQVVIEHLSLRMDEGHHAPSPQDPAMAWSWLLETECSHYLSVVFSVVPQRIQIASFDMDLPCAQGRCTLAGQLEGWRQSQERLRLDLLLQRPHEAATERHQLNLALELGFSLQHVELSGQLALDGQPLLRLEAGVEEQTGQKWFSSGEMRLEAVPQEPWLLDWLREWQPELGGQDVLPWEELALNGHWELSVPAGKDEAFWQRTSGKLSLDLGLPEGTVLPVIGAVGGELQVELGVSQGAITRYSLHGRVTSPHLPGVDPEWLPQGLNPGALVLHLSGQGEGRPDRAQTLPLTFRLESFGSLHGQLDGTLLVSAEPPYAIEFQDVLARLHSEQVEFGGGVVLRKASADWRISGGIDADGYRLALASNSHINAERLDQTQFSLERPVLKAGKFHLLGALSEPHFTGNLVLESPHLVQPWLHPQAWRWQGELDYRPGRLHLQGRVQNDSELSVQHTLLLESGQPWRFDWQLSDLFLLAGNPLVKTLIPWPEMLELERGRLSAQGRLTGATASEAMPRMDTVVGLNKVSGIYDRSLFIGASGDLRLTQEGRYLVLDTEGVRIERFNQGIELGPIDLAGSYSAPLNNLTDAMVHVSRLEAEVLGGRVWSEPMHFNLTERDVALPLVVRGIQLEEVFRLYHSAELEGNGQVDGLLPLRISRQGVTIDRGSLRARPPGGVLQYRAERAQALARSDARMRLIVDVLKDFHYSVLVSDIDYAQDGRLLLGVNLQGRNPGMVASPPVNLNITLEENLPLLLASLQLAENVGDKIKQRVSNSLERRGRAGNP